MALWPHLDGDDPMPQVLDRLTARGLAATPPFALVVRDANGASVRVVARGGVTVRVGETAISGAGVSTWAERVVDAGNSVITVVADSAASNAPHELPVVDGIVAAGAPEPAVFCHSYGSVVCGLAAHQLKAKDLVVLGSPGMRAADAGALNTSARVWAAKAPTDWIDKVPYVRFAGLGHGPDPAAPAFGARRVAADDVPGHGGYFAPGTRSLRTFAAIAQGDAR